MYNQKIARIFNEIANILEIKGDNPFRIRAYRRAAQNIEGLANDVSEITDEDIKRIPGIGNDLADKIREFISTGTIKSYEKLNQDVPSGLLDLLTIPGLGPRTAKMLFDNLKIKNINELEKYARKGLLRGLPGIQTKTEENIMKGITMKKRYTGRFPIGMVRPVADEILQKLKKAPVRELSIAGSLRRWKETIKDIDILATAKDAHKVMDIFVHLPQKRETLMRGPTKSSIITEEGIQVDLRVVDDDSFGAALAYFTGSKSHNVRLREMAVKKDLKINEYGIFDVKTDNKLGGKNESDIYKILGMSYIPCEMREDTGEIESALNNNLPVLVKQKDIRGDLHIHSVFSDGSHDIRDLVNMAKKREYKYIAITDHSKGLGIAGGMSAEQILDQNEKIKALNRSLKGFRILSGVETDIRGDGTLDYPDEILKRLDIVIASIHSGFRQSREQITKRVVTAMKNPYVSIIAHPTGRLIGEREAYGIDMDKVLRVAAETQTAMEINSYPFRLDLNDVHVRKAKEMEVPLAINTDAHTEPQFDFIDYGVGTARRGWLEKKDVLNTFTCSGLMEKLKSMRS